LLRNGKLFSINILLFSSIESFKWTELKNSARAQTKTSSWRKTPLQQQQTNSEHESSSDSDDC